VVPNQGHSAAPLAVKNMIIIGQANSGENGRGYVAAYTADTGKLLWRFLTVPNPGDPGSETWADPRTIPTGGGGVWTEPSFDPETNLAYFGTANPVHMFDPQGRPGDNLYTNSIIALDVDYTGQTGFVGAPISGAYVRQALTDIDYIRRVTLNVALVSQVNSTGLTLAEPLLGGAPTVGAKLQALTGFVDREGGSFYQEWSALFAMQGSQGERVFFHYPRLQTMASAEEVSIPLNNKNPAGQARVLLKAQFMALPVTDPLDGERVLCYRSFLPAANALV